MTTKTIRLSQILAAEKTIKSQGYGDFTKIHQTFQKAEPLTGISRTYQPRDTEGEQFPNESTQVQIRAKDVLKDAQSKLTELFDITASKDFANCEAKANIVVDSDTANPITIAENVPVTYLLWLEKQLTDLYTFAKNLPVLSPTEQWAWDNNQNCYRAEPSQSAKTKKIAKPFVKYEATKEHPAQVDVVTEDVMVGTWTTTKYSGALPAGDVESIRERVQKLQKAVKFAREEANGTAAPAHKMGEKVLGFIFNQSA